MVMTTTMMMRDLQQLIIYKQCNQNNSDLDGSYDDDDSDNDKDDDDNDADADAKFRNDGKLTGRAISMAVTQMMMMMLRARRNVDLNLKG